MKAPKVHILILASLLLLLAACSSNHSSVTSSTPLTPAHTSLVNCTFHSFRATVQHGPDAGLALQGDLHLTSDATGSLTGILKQTGGIALNVGGQATGRAINLIFDLGKDRLLFGVGTLQYPLQTCKGAAGGPLVGPREADSGDWGTPSKPGGSGGGN